MENNSFFLDTSHFFVNFTQEMNKNIPLDQFFPTTLNLICQQFSFTCACIFLENIKVKKDENLILDNYFVSPNFYQYHQTLQPFQYFNFYYNCDLTKGKSISLTLKNQNLPTHILNILNQHQLTNLVFIPLLYQTNYYGTIIFYQHHSDFILSENNLKLLMAIAINYSIFLNLKQQEEINNNLKKNDSKYEYLLQINHDLRTPITGIISFSQMLKKQIYGVLNNKQLEYITSIYESGNYLLNLIDNILDLIKLEVNQETLFLEKIEVEKICQTSLSLVQPLAITENLDLKLCINTNVNYFYGDSQKIKQILINLLSNAIKFTPKGTITLTVSQQKKQVKFSIVDTGIGINKNDQKRLFQPFTQLTNILQKKYKGTGLGLALSMKLAKLHGGNITLQSEEGKGSCFTVSLPINDTSSNLNFLS